MSKCSQNSSFSKLPLPINPCLYCIVLQDPLHQYEQVLSAKVLLKCSLIWNYASRIFDSFTLKLIQAIFPEFYHQFNSPLNDFKSSPSPLNEQPPWSNIIRKMRFLFWSETCPTSVNTFVDPSISLTLTFLIPITSQAMLLSIRTFPASTLLYESNQIILDLDFGVVWNKHPESRIHSSMYESFVIASTSQLTYPSAITAMSHELSLSEVAFLVTEVTTFLGSCFAL